MRTVYDDHNSCVHTQFPHFYEKLAAWISNQLGKKSCKGILTSRSYDRFKVQNYIMKETNKPNRVIIDGLEAQSLLNIAVEMINGFNGLVEMAGSNFYISETAINARHIGNFQMLLNLFRTRLDMLWYNLILREKEVAENFFLLEESARNGFIWTYDSSKGNVLTRGSTVYTQDNKIIRTKDDMFLTSPILMEAKAYFFFVYLIIVGLMHKGIPLPVARAISQDILLTIDL